MSAPANITLQPTVKKLRFLPSAELARWATRNMRSSFVALFLTLLVLGYAKEGSAQSQSSWQPGSYVLVDGKWDRGTLVIHSVSRATALFSLNVVNCMNNCGTAEAVNHVGDIDEGTMTIRGASGIYRESTETSNEPGTTPGCVIRFQQRQDRTILVSQEGYCESFGQGVGVAGVYKLEKNIGR